MRHSRVRTTLWIERQFLSGLSVHDFEPAPFEMDERLKCMTRRPLQDFRSISDELNPEDYLPPVDQHYPEYAADNRLSPCDPLHPADLFCEPVGKRVHADHPVAAQSSNMQRMEPFLTSERFWVAVSCLAGFALVLEIIHRLAEVAGKLK